MFSKIKYPKISNFILLSDSTMPNTIVGEYRNAEGNNKCENPG